MHEFTDAVELFIGVINNLKKEIITPKALLDEILIKTVKNKLSYIDNRRDTKKLYKFNFWETIIKQHKNRKRFIEKNPELNERILYSKSEQFPDFLFKVRKEQNKLTCGSLLELKDSKGGSIASFNSTLPTKYKTLEEIDTINGNHLVSKIVSILDGNLSSDKTYYSFPRRNFYFIRTHKGNNDAIKISIVDGSFFETVPKDHLIYQMLLNILRNQLRAKDIKMPSETVALVEKSLSYITDQTIIVASQTIDKASVKPRLRIMAEVHPEGNPHSSHYPKILPRTVNLIIQSSHCNEKITEILSTTLSAIEIFTIKHKRNGEHLVFQYRF